MYLPVLVALGGVQLLQPACALPSQQQRPLITTSPNDVQKVRDEFKKAEIIPTVIDDFLPSLLLSVAWSHKSASLGNTIKPKHLDAQPTITLHDLPLSSPQVPSVSLSNLTYIITLTDPDAPSRTNPKWSEMCHWIAANVTLSFSPSSSPSLLSTGLDDVMPYKPPGPPPKTGKHRYVFLVFAPRNGTTAPLELSRPKERKHWGTGEERGGVREWAEWNGLVPVAGQFLYSKDKKQ